MTAIHKGGSHTGGEDYVIQVESYADNKVGDEDGGSIVG